MAKGDPTSLQAKTGFNFRLYYQSLAANQEVPATPDDVEFTEIEGMKSGSLPSPDIPEIDVTTTTDPVKAYLSGTAQMTDISFEFNFYPQNVDHQNFVKNVVYSEVSRWWKITGQGMTYTFLGYLKSASATFGVDAALTLPLTLKVTSKPIVTFGAVTQADIMRGFASDEEVV